MSKEFSDRNQNLLIKLLIFAFLKEDKILFSKIKRPVIENLKYEEDKMLSNIGAYYKGVEDGVIKNTDIKFNFKNLESGNLSHEDLKKYSISFNPKPVKKIEDIQEFQARINFYHQLFSVGIFAGFALIIFYMTLRKEKK